MKLIAIIIMILWALLAGGVWAEEKDCFEAAKIEVGSRYLAKRIQQVTTQTFIVYDHRDAVREITILEISTSQKYALVKNRVEEKAYWEEVKNIEVIEKLPSMQGTLFLGR